MIEIEHDFSFWHISKKFYLKNVVKVCDVWVGHSGFKALYAAQMATLMAASACLTKKHALNPN